MIKSNSKCQLKALNLMKMVASHNSCAREIVHSMALLLTYCTVPMGRRNTGQVKVTLQIMTKSIKSSKAMAAKSSPCVATVVELIATWHRYDKKHGGRLLQIRKSLLTLMSAMSTSKECRPGDRFDIRTSSNRTNRQNFCHFGQLNSSLLFY